MLHDVLDPEELTEALAAGNVSVQTHPTLPLRIFNYTAACQYNRGWNRTTLACRGLIADFHNEVVARPFPKFFNYGEVPLADIPQNVPRVTAKMDGSLGIIYPTPDGHAVATRGSFTSDQAVWATGWLRRYAPEFQQPDGVTTLVEIIYPDNRVVVDYGGAETLVLIAAIRVDSGADVPPWEIDWWVHDRTMPFPEARTMEAAYRVGTSNAMQTEEGVVACWFRGNRESFRVKVKHPEYVRLHRILTNMSARRLWETAAVSDLRGRGCTAKEIGWATGLSAERVDQMLAQPDLFGPLLEKVPDEFYQWVKATVDGFHDSMQAFVGDAHRRKAEVVSVAGVSRKRMAAELRGDPLAGAVFKLLDGRDIFPMAWRSVRPAHELPFQSES